MPSLLDRFPEARTPTAAAALLILAVVVAATAGRPWALVCYLLCYAVAGWEPTAAGIQALRDRKLDVDVLMVLAAVAAAAIGQWQDGALLLVIFATSGALEDIATKRTERSVRALVDLAPEQADVVQDGAIHAVAAADLVPGQVVRIPPGGRLPADGTVLQGHSDIDESAITGEPLPASRGPGDVVYAGTLNGDGVLEVGVDVAGEASALGRITALVEEATAAQAPTQLFIERFEQRYAVGVVLATLALLVALPTVFGLDGRTTLLRAMTFMVVASPCAIILATMPALLSAVALAGRNEVLVKGGTALESLAGVDAVVLDKTGTLTGAAPRVVDVIALGDSTPEEVLRLAAAAEAGSEHVLADAVIAAAAERGLSVPAAAAVTALPGQGIRAQVQGRTVEVGNRRLVPLDEAATTAEGRIGAGGDTTVAVAVDGEPIGLLAIRDALRPGVPAAVARLRELGVRRVVLLTGDRVATAAAVAVEVGITEVHAELLPADKVAHVRALQTAGHRVLAVGDGLNDAPSSPRPTAPSRWGCADQT